MQNANSLLNKIWLSPGFGHRFHGSLGHNGLMELSRLTSSNLANDSLARLPREREGEASPPMLPGQQYPSWKELEFIEINLKALRGVK